MRFTERQKKRLLELLRPSDPSIVLDEKRILKDIREWNALGRFRLAKAIDAELDARKEVQELILGDGEIKTA